MALLVNTESGAPLHPRLKTLGKIRRPLFVSLFTRGSRLPRESAFVEVLAAIGFTLLAACPATAQIWNGGGGDNKWSTGTNWVGGIAPLNLGTAAVAFAGSTRLTPDMDANWNILSLTFNSGAGAFSLGSTGNFTLTIQNGGLTNNSTSTETINNAITLGAAQTWSATSGNLVFGGNIANGGNLLTVSGGSNTSASGIISGTGGLAMAGGGTLTLTGVNTYSGGTTINAGTVAVNSASALGASGVGATINAGTLEVTATFGSSRNFTLGSAASTIMVDPSQTFTIGNVLSGTGGLTKTGAGTLILTGANTYSGATTVSAGVVNVQNGAGLGTTAAGTTVASSATLQLQGGITVGTEALTISGVGASGQNGALVNVSGTNNYGGLITLGAAATLASDSGTLNLTNAGTITGATFGLTLAGSGNGSISSIIGTTSGTLTKSGSGTWTLTGANTYTGATTISAGVLNIQNATGLGTTAAGTTVSSGAALQIQGGIAVGAEALTLNGSGVSSDGALRNISGTNSMSSAITLGSAATIGSDAGTLTLSGALTNGGFLLTETGAGSMGLSGVVSGTGGLTVSGTGTLTLSGGSANTYTGVTAVNSGELDLNKNSGKNAYAGTLTIGDGAGAAGSAITRWLVANQVPATAVTINSDGLMDLNGFSDSIGTLTMTGGSITTGAGTLTIGGDVTTNASSTTATIAGNLGITVDRKFTVADGSAAVDLLVSANIVGAHRLTKEGTGTLVLSGTNAINDLLVNAGVVNLQNGGALGTATPTVAAGAALQVQGGLSLSNALTLNGSGISSDGALRNISGNNSFTGNVTLASDTTIGTDAGTLTLSGVVSGAGFSVTKVGAGTLTYGGGANNTYTGATVVNEGTLILSKTGNHTAIAGALTVGDASGSVTTGAGTLTLGGTVTGNASSSSATISGNLALGANRIFDSADGSATTDMLVSALISGAFSVTKNSGGELVFSNANTYTGTTTVNAGDLSISTFTLTPTGAATIAASATLTSTGVLNLTPSTTSGQTLISGAGTLLLRNSSSSAGSPDIYYDPSGGTGAGFGVTIASNVDVGTGNRYINGKSNRNDFERYGGDLIFGGNLTGSANLTFTGTPNTATGGPWQVAYVLQGNNSAFTGGVTLTDGANLILSNNNALTSANTLSFTPATGAVSGLYLNGHNVTIGALSGTSAGTMNIRNGALTTDTNAWITKSNATLTVQQNTDTTFNGIISDGPNDHGIGDSGTYYTLGLTKTGSGSLTLGGVNTYTGGTTINGGALVVNSASSLGATSGGLTINAGTLEVVTGFSTSRAITLGNAASTIQVDPSQTYTVTSAIGGTGKLNKTGSGIMVLSGNNTFSGGTDVTAGTLRISANERLANAGTLSVSGGTFDVQAFSETVGAVSLTGGSIIGSGAGTLTGSSYDMQSGTVSAILAGTAALTKTTSGTVTLSGVSTYTGGTTINSGTLVVNNVASLGAMSGGLTINAGTLEVATGFSTTRAITLGNSASTFQVDASQTYTVTTAIGGTGSLNKTGAGTMVLGATETYSGSTNVSAGTLQIDASNRVPDASALTVSGGTFDVQTFSETVAAVTLSGGSITGSGTGTLTGSSYSLQSGSASAILAGSGTVTKSTSGTVTLSGANTMTGAVTINGGTLTLAASSGSALGSTSAITVNSGGTLLLGASNQINNSATMNLAGGTFAKGNFAEGTTSAVGIGALTLSAGSHIDFGTGTVGILTFASLNPATFTLTIDNWTGNSAQVGSASTDRLIFNSDQASNLNSFLFTGYGAGGIEFNLGGGFWEVVAAVPEPSTWFVGVLGLATIGGSIVRHALKRRE